MLRVFLEVVLPVALVALAGGVIGRWRNLSVGPASTLVFYLFSPALVFNAMATTELSADVSFRIVAAMLVSFAAMYLAATGWSIFRRHEAPMRAATALGATTPNAGNMGLPVATLAFGDAGLQVAVVNFVAGAVMSNSVGIAIASMAGGNRREALRAPFRYPVLYAGTLGIIINILNIDLPITIKAPVESLAAAAVPTMLVVLGLQLQNVGGRNHLVDTLAVNVGRLIIAPGAAYIGATLLGLGGVNRDALVVLAAMPTAVIATILATEFKAEPSFVTGVVVSSTLASMVSLTLLITLLR